MRIILIFILLYTISACNSKHNSILQKAESYMETSPDSALNFLESIPFPKEPAAQARYALLMTQAMYKTGIPRTSDSLINIAVDYYRKESDNEKKALAYVYKGAAFQDKEQYSTAITWYKQAEELIPYIQNPYVNMTICEFIGYALYANNANRQAILYYEQAYQYAHLTKRKETIARIAGNIIFIFTYLEEIDKAIHYLNIALENISYADSSIQAGIFQNAACLYMNYPIGEDSTTLMYIHKAIKLQTNKQDALSAYLLLAQWYSQHNDSLKADSLWKQALLSENLYTQAAACHMMAEHYEAYDKHALANFYMKQFNELHDSIDRIVKHKEVIEVLHKHDANRIRKEMWWSISICITICTIIILIICRLYKHEWQQKKIMKQLVLKARQETDITNNNDLQLLLDIMRNKNISQTTDDIYEHFCQLYNLIDSHFIKKLIQSEHKLSSKLKLYCILMRIGKNDNEILKIMACSPDALKMTKKRLRDILGLKADRERKVLEEYIRSL